MKLTDDNFDKEIINSNTPALVGLVEWRRSLCLVFKLISELLKYQTPSPFRSSSINIPLYYSTTQLFTQMLNLAT